jgi:chorismate mutase
MLTAVEVANAQHAYEALKHGVDILWIGARTSVNPFSVQEIADAIRGADVPVLVKNPVNPDIQLWIGALERINQAGITKIAAIHRGFHSFEKTKYRNAPKWDLAIELKTLLPELPIICDPSHICGRTDLIQAVSQKALDLDMAGLMIESHINPPSALSDAKQQLTPDELGHLLDNLVIREASVENKEFHSKLVQLRSIIDEIDDELMNLLGKRMGISVKIGEYKRDNKVTILQVNRWEEIVNRRTAMGEAMGLKPDFIKQMLQLVHKESIRKQTDVMNAELKMQDEELRK